MIYKKLRINNIASVVDAEIDFLNGPVANDSLILICGETGAGKTTILDAICLCLFGTTPRMEQAHAESFDSNINTNNVCQVLRKGERNGFAELEFEGANGKQYTARFEVRLKNTGKPEKKSYLHTSDNTVDLEKISDIKTEIEQHAVGSNFNNFLRTNMLAQGEFAKFLDGKEDEKAEVLEQLTGTEIYEKIGQKIYASFKEKNNELDKANQEIAVQKEGLLSDEQFQELNERLTTNKAQCLQLEKQKQETESKGNWLQQERNLTQQLHDAQQKLAQATALQQDDNYKKEEQLLADFNTALNSDALANLAELNNHRKTLKELQNDEPKQHLAATHLANLIQAHNTTVNKKREEIYALAKYLDGITDRKKKEIENVEKVSLKISNMQDNIREENHHKNKSIAFASKKKELADNLHDKKVMQKNDEHQTTVIAKALEEVQEALAKLNPNTVNAQANLLQQLIGEVRTQQTLRETFSSASVTLEKAEKELQEATDRIPQLNRKLQLAGHHFDTAKNVLDHLELSTNDYARQLRHDFKQGDVCPVCGRTIEEEIKEEFFTSLLEKPKQEFDEALTELNNAKTELQTAENLHKIKKENIATVRQNFENAKLNYDASQLRANEICDKLNNLDTDSKKDWKTYITDTDTEAKLLALDEKLELLLKQQQQVSTLNTELNLQRRRMDDQRNKQDEYSKSLFELEKQINQCESDIKREKELADKARIIANKAAQHISTLLGTDDWFQEWEGRWENYAAELTREATEYKKDVERKREMETEAYKLRQVLDMAKQQLDGLQKRVPQWKIEAGADVLPSDNLIVEVNDTIASIGKWLHECTSTQTAITDREKRIATFLAGNVHFTTDYLQQLIEQKGTLMQAKVKHDATNNTVKEAKTKLEVLTGQLTDLNTKRPTFDADEEGRETAYFQEMAETLGQQIKTLSQENGGHQAKLDADRRLRSTIDSKLKAVEVLKAKLAPWNELNTLLGDAKGNKFKKIAQNYVLSSLLVLANRFLQQFAPRFTLFAKPGLLTILAYDAENLNEPLSSASLSGGQKFMVSLALALGLAEMCGGVRTGANILFIDEGFGSLDDNCLDSVMNSLEKLHQHAQRKVAIISHVERLRTQIPTHVEVTLLPGQSAASQVKIVSMEG